MANPTPATNRQQKHSMKGLAMHRHLIAKVVGAVVLMTALGGGVASAFTAGNSVNTSLAGEGVGAVSGYVVSNIHYTITQEEAPVIGNDAVISGVSFTLNNPASSAGYALYDANNNAVGGGTCTNTNNYNWTCTEANNGYAPVYQVTQLDVTAAN